MNITSKSRYGLKIMIELAYRKLGDAPVSGHMIAARRGIATKYLDQIMLRLRAHGLVTSTRGRTGGYKLAKPSEEISVWDIFAAVEDHLAPVECIDSKNACEFELACVTFNAWHNIYKAFREPLEKMTLASLVTGEDRELKFIESLNDDVRKCRSGHMVGEEIKEED